MTRCSTVCSGEASTLEEQPDEAGIPEEYVHEDDEQNVLHLSDVVAVASRAFLAYQNPANEPLRTEAELCHLGTIQTTVRYVDGAFMSRLLQAAVVVSVASVPDGARAKSPPYIRANLRHSFGTHAGRLRPWDKRKTFTLFAHRADAGAPDARELVIEAWDAPPERPTRGRGRLASAVLQLPPLNEANELQEYAVLLRDGRTVCTVHVAYRVCPFHVGVEPQIDMPIGVAPLVPQHPATPLPSPNGIGDMYATESSPLFPGWVALGRAVNTGPCGWDGLKAAALVRCERTHTEAWVYSNPGAETVLLAFRGTEISKLVDYVTDLKFRQVSLDSDPGKSRQETEAAMATEESQTGLLELFWGPEVDTPMVHRGFNAASMSVLPTLYRLVDGITGGDAAWTVITTGHSLGGALSTLAAYRLRTRLPAEGPQYNVVDLTFASPRVGNAAFVRHFAEHVKRSWRVHRSDDLVPEVPPGKNYVHVPHAVRVDPEQQEIHLRAAAELRAGSIATGAGVSPIARVLVAEHAHGVWRRAENVWHIARLLASPLFGIQGHRGSSYLRCLADLVDKVSNAAAMREAVSHVRQNLRDNPLALA